MSFQSRLEMFNNLGPMGTPLQIQAEKNLPTSFKVKSDSHKNTTTSVHFEKTESEMIHRKPRRATVRRPTKVDEILKPKSIEMEAIQIKPNARTIKRSMTIGSIQPPMDLPNSIVLKSIPEPTPKIEIKSYDSILENQKDELKLGKKSPFISNTTSVILVLIFIVFTKLFL